MNFADSSVNSKPIFMKIGSELTEEQFEHSIV